MENSNPIMWFAEKWYLFIIINIMVRNKEPIKTWIPWNPVEIKKIDPKILSEKEK